MILVMYGFLLVGFAAAVRCFSNGHRRAAVVLVGIGLAATVAGVTLPLGPALAAAGGFALVAGATAVRIPTAEPSSTSRSTSTGAARARRIVVGGAVGLLPGALVISAALVLHETGVISSDQSQLAFVGVPIGLIGLVIGALFGASGTSSDEDETKAGQQTVH